MRLCLASVDVRSYLKEAFEDLKNIGILFCVVGDLTLRGDRFLKLALTTLAPG